MAAPAFANMTLYQQNFDTVGQAALTSPGAGNSTTLSSILPGWSAMANNAAQTTVGVVNGTIGGYAVGVYLGTGDGTDFGLATYETGNGHTDWIKYTYTATTVVSDITGSFDYLSPWTRYASTTAKSAGFENGLTYQLNGGADVSLDNTWHVTNANVTSAGDVTTWLTDARMAALGLSTNNLTFSLTGVALNPGDELAFTWAGSVCSRDRNMMQGIDNFKLEGVVPVPLPGALLLGLLGLGSVGVGLRKHA